MKETSTPEEQVSFIANARGNNPYNNTYNPRWRNHPNFAWPSPTNPRPPGFHGPMGNYQPRPTFIQQRRQFQNSNFQQPYQAQGGQGFQQQQQVDKFSKLEDLVTTFVSTRSQKFGKIEKFMDVTTSKFTSIESGLRSHHASLHNLEVQIGNLVGILTERPKGALRPSQTVANRKDHARVNSIQLRSGKVTPEVVSKEVNVKEDPLPEGGNEETLGENRGVARKASSMPPPVAEYTPPLPFRTRVHKEQLEAECRGFLEMLRKLHLNIPFFEAMAHMPRYSKYLKGLLSKKQNFQNLAN
ncbi:unnamed protein product [Linum trigynum]|uniref:Reverse transcriptase domain-containing protein n=1 Tax=Linum trigynum TaxID=586398 RepID=A0AAV2E7C1_9ROSI